MLQYLQTFLHTLTSWSVGPMELVLIPRGVKRDNIQMCSGDALDSGVGQKQLLN